MDLRDSLNVLSAATPLGGTLLDPPTPARPFDDHLKQAQRSDDPSAEANRPESTADRSTDDVEANPNATTSEAKTGEAEESPDVDNETEIKAETETSEEENPGVETEIEILDAAEVVIQSTEASPETARAVIAELLETAEGAAEGEAERSEGQPRQSPDQASANAKQVEEPGIGVAAKDDALQTGPVVPVETEQVETVRAPEEVDLVEKTAATSTDPTATSTQGEPGVTPATNGPRAVAPVEESTETGREDTAEVDPEETADDLPRQRQRRDPTGQKADSPAMQQTASVEAAATGPPTEVTPADSRPQSAPTGSNEIDPAGPVRATASQTARQSAASEGANTSAAEQVDRARFVQRVTRAFEAVGDRGGSVRLRLRPPELGVLQLEISVRNGQMTARMETETSAARAVLLENLPALRERLAEQDIKIEQFEVDLMKQSGDGSPELPDSQDGWRDQTSDNPRRQPGEPQEETEPPTRPGPISPSGEGSRLDVTI